MGAWERVCVSVCVCVRVWERESSVEGGRGLAVGGSGELVERLQQHRGRWKWEYEY